MDSASLNDAEGFNSLLVDGFPAAGIDEYLFLPLIASTAGPVFLLPNRLPGSLAALRAGRMSSLLRLIFRPLLAEPGLYLH